MRVETSFPEMPTADAGVYQVYAMRYAHVPRRVHENFIFNDEHDGPMPVDYNLWIIRNAARTILVDTGFGRRASAERGRPLLFDPVEGLAKLGIDPDAIEDVVITHLHYDHAGNIDRFGKARFHIQDDEVSFATGRCMCERHLRFAFDVEDVVTLVRRTYADRVSFHDGDADLYPGIRLIKLPGHSAAVQGVHVMTPRGPILLASDGTHYFANLIRRSPFIIAVDAAETLASYSRMMEIAGGLDRLIPGHDPKLRRLYPTVRINGIDLLELHEPPSAVDPEELARVDDFGDLQDA